MSGSRPLWKMIGSSKEALHNHLEKGYRGSLYSLVTVDQRTVTNEYVDAEEWLLPSADTLGTKLAASAIRVDPDKSQSCMGRVQL
jgi:hypothetical protein